MSAWDQMKRKDAFKRSSPAVKMTWNRLAPVFEAVRVENDNLWLIELAKEGVTPLIIANAMDRIKAQQDRITGEILAQIDKGE